MIWHQPKITKHFNIYEHYGPNLISLYNWERQFRKKVKYSIVALIRWKKTKQYPILHTNKNFRIIFVAVTVSHDFTFAYILCKMKHCVLRHIFNVIRFSCQFYHGPTNKSCHINMSMCAVCAHIFLSIEPAEDIVQRKHTFIFWLLCDRGKP